MKWLPVVQLLVKDGRQYITPCHSWGRTAHGRVPLQAPAVVVTTAVPAQRSADLVGTAVHSYGIACAVLVKDGRQYSAL